MSTKVRKKGSIREKVAASKMKAWAKHKASKGWTYFDLMMQTKKSEGTIRTAFKGYADKATVEAIDKAFGITAEPKNQEAA